MSVVYKLIISRILHFEGSKEMSQRVLILGNLLNRMDQTPTIHNSAFHLGRLRNSFHFYVAILKYISQITGFFYRESCPSI